MALKKQQELFIRIFDDEGQILLDKQVDFIPEYVSYGGRLYSQHNYQDGRHIFEEVNEAFVEL